MEKKWFSWEGIEMKFKDLASTFSGPLAAKVTLGAALLVMAIIVGLAVMTGGQA